MDDFKKSAKITHSLNVLSSFNELKQSDCICNFTIKVGDKSFKVHRDLLGAVSKYFKGMFSSNMVEARNGFVVMKDICADAVGQCVDFMYTGEANPTMESVENTLYASHLMQLDVLSSICFDFMENNLSVQHCLLVGRLARLYDRTELETIAERFIVDNFESLILGEDFFHLSKEKLIFYGQKLNKKHEVVWHAVRRWISNKGEKIGSELMETLHFGEFPYKFLLTDLLTDSLVKSSSDAKKKIKWEAALKWAKQSRRHQKLFPDLFELIKLQDFSGDFIRQTVRNEPLVEESHKCKDLLLDVLCARTEVKKYVPHIAVSSDTGIKTLNFQTN
ncbi:kelch-like protein 12 [Styela clava]